MLCVALVQHLIYVIVLLHLIGGVLVSMLASSVVDRGFEPRSSQSKDYRISVCCLSAKHGATGWFGIRIMCPSGSTCLSMYCCFSELAL